MTADMGESTPLGRNSFRGVLLALAGFGVAALVFCVVYVVRQPCPSIAPARDAERKAFLAAYPQDDHTHEITSGSTVSRLLCRMDSLLCPVESHNHLLLFLGAVPNQERHETYYVFAPPQAVDIYYVYVIKDGAVMPQERFVTGGA